MLREAVDTLPLSGSPAMRRCGKATYGVTEGCRHYTSPEEKKMLILTN